MLVFLTGANGWLGSSIASELMGAGHRVVGLVRSIAKGEALAASGATPVIGSLDNLDLLRTAARDADGIIHTAFGLDFSDYAKLGREDRDAIQVFGEILKDTDRPLVVTSGLGRLVSGQTFTEDDRPPVMPEYPRESEQMAFALARCGVRASVVRPARSVHGIGERHGFIPMLAARARERGVSAYIDEGRHPWAAVHRLDAARVYRFALERAAGGEAYHAVAESLPFRDVAEAIGRQTGVPTISVPEEDAASHFEALAPWVCSRDVASSDRTREWLGWEPREVGLVADIDCGDYFSSDRS